MGKHVSTEDVLKRLAKIQGQIKGITAMIEAERPCEDVLIQISSVKAALHKVGYIMLEDHLEHCVVHDIKAGNEEETIKSIKRTLKQFSQML